MTRLTAGQSAQAESQEARMERSGNYRKNAITVTPDGKMYLGDGRKTNGVFRKSDLLVDVNAWKQGQIYGASGETEKLDGLSIYGAAWYANFEGYDKVNTLLENNPWMTPQQVTLSGAAGEEAITQYETVRKSATILGSVSGQQRLEEKLNATNIADMVNTTDFKVEFVKKTSAVNSVDKELADDQMPSDIRSAFAVDTKEIFADGTSWQTSLRDKDLKVDISAEINKEIPGMFLQAKHDKVITLVNALSTNNLGDWTARDATHGFFTVKAAADLQTAEEAIEAYGGSFVCLMNSDTWLGYQENTGQTYHFDTRPANTSTNIPSNRSGTLAANNSIQYWITDDITSESFILASKENYMKFIQGMQINTTFTDERTAGQTSWQFKFDYNGAFENETGAAYHGATTLS